MVLVDTNVILDIATNDPQWFDWSHAQLEPLINAGEAAINPVIYAELVPAARAVADLDTVIVPPGDFQRLPLPYCKPPQFLPRVPSPPIVKPAARRHRRRRIFSWALTLRWKI